MLIHNTRVGIGFLVTVMAVGANAQQPLSLEQAVDLALKQSPVLQAARAEVNMAEAQVRAAKAKKKPGLSTSTFLTTGDMPSIIPSVPPVMPESFQLVPRQQQWDQNLAFMLPVYTGGRLSASVRKADWNRRAASADYASMELDVALATKAAYRQALLARATVEIYEQMVKEAAERLRIDEEAYNVGKIALYNVLRDKAELANAQQMLTDSKRDLEMAKVDLRTAMGITDVTDYQLTDQLDYQARTSDLSELLDQAEKQNPRLTGARRRIEAADAEVAAKKGAFKPQIGLMGMSDHFESRTMGSDTGYTVGVVGSLPILDGGMRKAELSEARSRKQKTVKEYEQSRIEVRAEVQKICLALTAAEQNVKTSETALTSAEEDYRIAQLRYTSGKGVNVEALDAYVALVRARTNRVRALYAYNVAFDQLKRAIGEK